MILIIDCLFKERKKLSMLFDLVNGISTLVGYSTLKLSLLEDSSSTI